MKLFSRKGQHFARAAGCFGVGCRQTHLRPMAEATSGDRNRKRRTAMLSLVNCSLFRVFPKDRRDRAPTLTGAVFLVSSAPSLVRQPTDRNLVACIRQASFFKSLPQSVFIRLTKVLARGCFHQQKKSWDKSFFFFFYWRKIWYTIALSQLCV